MTNSLQSFTAATHPLRISQLEQLPFELPEDWTWDAVEERLEQLGYRGAVVGPHGSGKTTFLLELAERLKRRGRQVEVLFTNLEAGKRLPPHWLDTLSRANHGTVVIADGYDVLSWRQRRKLRRVLRPQGGLLITAHRQTLLEVGLAESRGPVDEQRVHRMIGLI